MDEDFIMTLSDSEAEAPVAGPQDAAAAVSDGSDSEEFEMQSGGAGEGAAAPKSKKKKKKQQQKGAKGGKAQGEDEGFVFEVEDERAADPWDFKEMRAVHKTANTPGSSSIGDKIARRLGGAGDGSGDEDGGADGDASSSSDDEEEERERLAAHQKRLEAREAKAEAEAKKAKKASKKAAKKAAAKGDDGKTAPDGGKISAETVRLLKEGDVQVAPRQPEAEDFGALNVSRPLLRAVKDLGFVRPTPVQGQAVPLALEGSDLLVSAMTGSGKTAAFMLPVLERLLYRPRRVALTRVLVLSPTRELAAQCQSMTEKLAKYSDVRVSLVVGGLSAGVQETELRSRPDIVVATPGRLIDHLRNSRGVHLDDVEILVLDEADRLLEKGFADEVREIVSQCPRGRQTLLFSATLNRQVAELANLSLNRPRFVAINAVNSVVDTLSQEFVRVRRGNEESCEAIVLALCRRSFRSKTIVFVRSKKEAHRLMIVFGLAKLRAAELHGNLTQLQRLEALDNFRRGEVDFLICTDLAARGLDIVGVEVVLNASMPHTMAQYIHRVGRTARAGRSGRSVSLVTEDGRRLLKQIMAVASDVVTARQVPSRVVSKYRRRIEAMEGDIDAILGEEGLEKEIRLAEMEANKTRNLVVHEDDIRSRPKRTWFQTEREKQNAKLAALSEHRGEDPAAKAREAEDERKRAEREERRALKAKAKAKDPLRGLSRKKKRQKMAKMQAEAEMKERRRELESGRRAEEVGMTGEQKQIRSARMAKSKARREAAGGDADASGAVDDAAAAAAPGRKRSKKQGAVSVDYDTAMEMLHQSAAPGDPRRRKYRGTRSVGDLLDDEGQSFTRRYAGSVDRQERKMREEEAAERKKRKAAAGPHGNFKSKKKYRRR